MQTHSICLVQPPENPHAQALLDVARLLTHSLQSLGLPCRAVVNAVDPDAVNIVVGYHMLAPELTGKLAPLRVVLYQLEQLPEREGWFTAEREALLRSAWAVWDYSPENLDVLRARGCRRVFFLPFGYHPSLELIRHRPEADKDIDVLFYGAINDRRRALIGELKRRLRTEWLFGVYGEARDASIARTRIVLNVHFHPARIIEQVRVAYLLNNRCFVISEEAEQNPYGAGIMTGRFAELPDLCEQFAVQPEARRQIAESGYQAFRGGLMVEHLRAVLQQMSLL